MAFERNPDELGALWIKHGPNSDYMTGEINGIKVVVFKSKKTSEKSPDWRVLKSKPDEKKPIADVDVPF